MAEEFDPYLQWLGIRDTERPPNHYRLLGVEVFESDPDVISSAADRQMGHVRTFAGGTRADISQQLLNELSAARVCLLNAEKKEAYDRQLRSQLPSSASRPADGDATESPSESAPEIKVDASKERRPRSRSGRSSGRSRSGRSRSGSSSSSSGSGGASDSSSSGAGSSRQSESESGSGSSRAKSERTSSGSGKRRSRKRSEESRESSERDRPLIQADQPYRLQKPGRGRRGLPLGMIITSLATLILLGILWILPGPRAWLESQFNPELVDAKTDSTQSADTTDSSSDADDSAETGGTETDETNDSRADGSTESMTGNPTDSPGGGTSDSALDQILPGGTGNGSTGISNGTGAGTNSSTLPNPSDSNSQQAVAPWNRRPQKTNLPPGTPNLVSRGTGLLGPFFRSLRNRDLLTAKSTLKTAIDSARTPDERAELEYGSLLLEQLDPFWDAVRGGTANVRPGDQIEFRGETVEVVSWLGGKLTLRTSAGEEASFDTDKSAIPPDVAIGLAQLHAQRTGPAVWMMIGSFLAVDGKGDLQRARSYLSKADRQGLPADVLLEAIEHMSSMPSLPTPNQTPITPNITDTNSTSPPARPKPIPRSNEKRPVPSKGEQADALATIKSLFAREFNSRDAASQTRLAKTLLGQGRQTDKSSPAAYVLLSQARQLAATSGNIQLALDAVDELQESYKIDAWNLRSESVLALRKPAKSSPGLSVELMHVAARLADQANASRRYDVANRLVGNSLALANSLKQQGWAKRMQLLRTEVTRTQALFSEARRVKPVLMKSPADPKANLVIGRFMSFVQGNFDLGLPRLSVCSDEKLKSLAVLDRSSPEDATQQVDLGDKWMTLSKSLKGTQQRNTRARAIHWYKKAMVQQTGLTAEQTRQRLEAAKAVSVPVLEENRIDLTHLVPVAKLRFGKLGINENPDTNERPEISGADASRFIWAPAPSQLSYPLPPSFRTFSAIGYLGSDSPTGLRFVVNADGKAIFTSNQLRKKGQQAIIRVDVPQGTQFLHLLAKPSTNNASPGSNFSYWISPELSR